MFTAAQCCKNCCLFWFYFADLMFSQKGQNKTCDVIKLRDKIHVTGCSISRLPWCTKMVNSVRHCSARPLHCAAVNYFAVKPRSCSNGGSSRSIMEMLTRDFLLFLSLCVTICGVRCEVFSLKTKASFQKRIYLLAERSLLQQGKWSYPELIESFCCF